MISMDVKHESKMQITHTPNVEHNLIIGWGQVLPKGSEPMLVESQ